jgi:hypothetical protein
MVGMGMAGTIPESAGISNHETSTYYEQIGSITYVEVTVSITTSVANLSEYACAKLAKNTIHGVNELSIVWYFPRWTVWCGL